MTRTSKGWGSKMSQSNATIARRYGKALFELAQEKQVLEDVQAELTALNQAFNEESQFMLFMTSPQITEDAKQAMLTTITANLSLVTKNLVTMLYDYRRLVNFDGIVSEFNRLNDEYHKTVRATVTTAIELDDEQKDKLASSFANVVGANKVVVDTVVDESIIGGVILHSNSYIYDGSIKSKIEHIKRLLLK